MLYHEGPHGVALGGQEERQQLWARTFKMVSAERNQPGRVNEFEGYFGSFQWTQAQALSLVVCHLTLE